MTTLNTLLIQNMNCLQENTNILLSVPEKGHEQHRVKELRKAQGISQKTLAARLQTEGFEFTDLTILRIEQGKRFVPDYEIVAIANYFHISTDYLLGLTDTK